MFVCGLWLYILTAHVICIIWSQASPISIYTEEKMQLMKPWYWHPTCLQITFISNKYQTSLRLNFLTQFIKEKFDKAYKFNVVV